MNKYHKKFLSSYTAENIIALFSRYRGAPKEITESWGMLEAAKRIVEDLGSCKIIVVGDGCSPRTGAIFAYFTKAEVVSIDPCFNMAHWQEHVRKQTAMGFPPQRLEVIKERVEDVTVFCEGRMAVAIWPHSHASMLNLKLRHYTDRIDIAMPCCRPIPAAFMKRPHITYEDYNIASPKRTIHIFSDELEIKSALYPVGQLYP